MRRTNAALGLAAAMTFTTSAAWSADIGGKAGTKGASAPSTSSAAEATPSGPETVSPQTVAPETRSDARANPDVTARRVEIQKPWEIGGNWELHRLFRQDDLEGAGANKVFNVLGVYGRYDLSDNDRVAIADFFTQNYIADQGETGIRSGDVSFRYTRTQPLPRQFVFSVSGLLSAPTSFQSQKAGLITAPTVVLQLDKKFGRYVGVSAHLSGGFAVVKYREQEGGGPNGKWRAGAGLEADVTMPFHEPLSVGFDVATNYLWLYDVQSSGGTPYGVTQDPQFPNGQPMQQSYGGEIFARYLLPQLAGVKSDFSLAVANGDSSLAYNSVLHDGVSQFYLLQGFRQTSEVYASFSVRY